MDSVRLFVCYELNIENRGMAIDQIGQKLDKSSIASYKIWFYILLFAARNDTKSKMTNRCASIAQFTRVNNLVNTMPHWIRIGNANITFSHDDIDDRIVIIVSSFFGVYLGRLLVEWQIQAYFYYSYVFTIQFVAGTFLRTIRLLWLRLVIDGIPDWWRLNIFANMRSLSKQLQ